MTPDTEYWEQRWLDGQTGWDLATVSPPIADFVRTLTDKNMRILIPGCGNAHEAVFLMQEGFTRVTVIDIAPTPVAQLKQQLAGPLAQGHVQVVCGDFFAHHAAYDLIIEQTFFCALQPEQRMDYARHMYRLLAPGGRLAGLLFNRQFEGGPPFGGAVAEYRTYFEPLFDAVTFEACHNSVAPRAGSEVWFEAWRKA